jgi:hypothetical protein
MDEFFIVFDAPSHAMRGEKILFREGLRARLVNVPRAIAENCGLALRLDGDAVEPGLTALRRAGVGVKGVYNIRRGEFENRT